MVALVNECIKKLPKKCKEVFVLSKKRGFTNIEISEKLNISIKTVEAHISMAFKSIRANINIPNNLQT